MAKRPKPVHQMTEREFEKRFPFGDDELQGLSEGPPLAAGRSLPALWQSRASMTCRRASGTGSARNALRAAITAIVFRHGRNDLREHQQTAPRLVQGRALDDDQQEGN